MNGDASRCSRCISCWSREACAAIGAVLTKQYAVELTEPPFKAGFAPAAPPPSSQRYLSSTLCSRPDSSPNELVAAPPAGDTRS